MSTHVRSFIYLLDTCEGLVRFVVIFSVFFSISMVYFIALPKKLVFKENYFIDRLYLLNILRPTNAALLSALFNYLVRVDLDSL